MKEKALGETPFLELKQESQQEIWEGAQYVHKASAHRAPLARRKENQKMYETYW